MGWVRKLHARVAGALRGWRLDGQPKKSDGQHERLPSPTPARDYETESDLDSDSERIHLRACRAVAGSGLEIHSDDDVRACYSDGRSQFYDDSESVYSCHNLKEYPHLAQYRRIPAEVVRRQVRNAPRLKNRYDRESRYPKPHRGHEHENRQYKLRAKRSWVEFPILNEWDGRCWEEGQRPGPVRAVYNDDNRDKFDVLYHDPTNWQLFSKAEYHPSTSPRGTGFRWFRPRESPRPTKPRAPGVSFWGTRNPASCAWQEITFSYERIVRRVRVA